MRNSPKGFSTTSPPARAGTVTAMQVDFDRATDFWEETQAFLRQEFAR
jgi:hypothetical protein